MGFWKLTLAVLVGTTVSFGAVEKAEFCRNSSHKLMSYYVGQGLMSRKDKVNFIMSNPMYSSSATFMSDFLEEEDITKAYSLLEKNHISCLTFNVF